MYGGLDDQVDFHLGTFSRSARNANTSRAGRSIVTVFVKDVM